METGWSDAVAADLQALAQLAALHIPDRPVLTLTDEAEALPVRGDRSEACPGLRSRGETDDWVDEETLAVALWAVGTCTGRSRLPSGGSGAVSGRVVASAEGSGARVLPGPGPPMPRCCLESARPSKTLD